MSIKRVIFNIIDVVCKVVLVAIAVMFIIRAVRFAYDLGLQVFDQRPASAADSRTISFTVSGTDSVADIADALEGKGLIRDARIFRIQERLSVYHDMIGAGTYALSPSMTPDEIIAVMAAPTVEERKNMKEAEKNFEAAMSAEKARGGDEAAEESDDTAGMGPSAEESGENAGDAQTPDDSAASPGQAAE